MTDIDTLLAAQPFAAPSLTGARGRPPEPERDPIVVRRNRRNRQRGKSTSNELAKYLGIQNVEGMNWPWDCQSNAVRLQSKRDQLARGPLAALRLIEYIPDGDFLRGLFWVAPRARLTSGSVTVLLKEWTDTYGWLLPAGRLSLAAMTPLLTLPLPLFADYTGRLRVIEAPFLIEAKEGK